MTDLERIERAIQRIQQGHSKGAPAWDSQHVEVASDHPNARAWCIGGACGFWTLDGNDVQEKLNEVLFRAAKRRGFTGFINFNDHPDTTQDDVLAVLYEVKAQL